MVRNIAEHSKCTGCKMCADICPTGAISYSLNREGFWYPKIDHLKCVNCHLCERMCPQNREYRSDKRYPEIYYAWNRNDKVRLKSTSGGLFYTFAKQVIEQGGYVVGCRYTENFKGAYHVIVDDFDSLGQLIGSKYFQSDTEHIYEKTREALEERRKVLFCGTPCQVAALYQFLGKAYAELITMDFICLGINSPKAYEAYITEQEKKHKAKVSYVQLKNKKQGWLSLASYMEFQNGKSFLADKDEDWWIKGYIKENLYMRQSCYQCQYRKIPRVADISVGDFWGITKVSKSNLFKGISAVMINSENGSLLFDSVKQDLFYREKSMEELRKGNIALEESPRASENRAKFFDLLDKMPFSKAVRRCSVEEKNFHLELNRHKIPRICKERSFEYLKENKLLDKIDIKNFIYYNYCSSNIERDEGVYLIPYKNSIIDLDATAKIYIRNKNIEVGINKLRKSRAETHLRMGKNAQWISKRGAGMFYNTVLEICTGAKFESGFFTANGGSVIVCAKHIVFGENVMLGRNIIIYDSDHHQILDENNKVKNYGQDVIIEDHVWLTSNITVLKGVRIGKGSVVGAQTTITKNLPSNAFVVGSGSSRVLNQNANWSRKTVR